MRIWPAVLICILLVGASTVLVRKPDAQAAESVAAADAASSAFELPSWRAGDELDYNGSYHIGFTVASPTVILDEAHRNVTAIPITVHTGIPQDPTLQLDAQTGVIERADVPCTIAESTPTNCMPWLSLVWDIQGLPAVLGTSILMGRTLHVGDSWTVEGDCRACQAPIRVAIRGPTETSPVGTTAVADITVPSDWPFKKWVLTHATLHLSPSSPYPLLIESGAKTLVLERLARGTEPLRIGAMPATHPLSIAPIRSTDGLPAEGTPPETIPSWSDARVATRNQGSPDPSQLAPLASLRLYVGAAGIGIIGSLEVEGRAFDYTATTMASTGAIADYYNGTEIASGLPRSDLRRTWTWQAGASSASVPCDEPYAPLWDVIGSAVRDGTVSQFSGFIADFKCGSPTMNVIGGPHGGGHFQQLEVTSLDLRTGWLSAAQVWPGPSTAG